MAGPGIDSLNSNLEVWRAGQSVVQTVIELARARNLQQVIDDLKLDTGPDNLIGQMAVVSNIESQVLSITLRSTDRRPAIAA